MEDKAIAQENIYGEMAAIRAFDINNPDDVLLFQKITESDQYRQWMDEAEPQTKSQIKEWIIEAEGKDSYLVAVSGSEGVNLPEIGQIQGFIWLYKSKEHPGAYEVSYAKRQGTPSGQIASGLRQMLVKYNFLHHNHGLSDSPLIEVYSNPWTEKDGKRIQNIRSVRVTEEAGFVCLDDWEWKLDWSKLNDIVHKNGEAKSLPQLAKLVTMTEHDTDR